MAKVTGPLMSLDASGTVGNTITFSKWNGKNYVRHRVIPQNRKTDAQASSRTFVGGTGYALSFVMTVAKDSVNHVGSLFYQSAVMAAPAGQSWISNAMTKILGTNFGTIEANVTSYGVLDGTHKGYWDTNAGLAGLADFNLSYGAQSPLAKGNLLYCLAKFAVTYLGSTAFAAGVDAATSAEIEAFVDEVADTNL